MPRIAAASGGVRPGLIKASAVCTLASLAALRRCALLSCDVPPARIAFGASGFKHSVLQNEMLQERLLLQFCSPAVAL